MPKAYVLMQETIRDAVAMQAYGEKAMPTILGTAQILAADEGTQVLEGEWPADRTVLLEFDSVDAAQAWYASPEYQAALPLRRDAADTNAVILTGL